MAKVIQIAAAMDKLYTLADDGSLWVYRFHQDPNLAWREIRRPPRLDSPPKSPIEQMETVPRTGPSDEPTNGLG